MLSNHQFAFRKQRTTLDPLTIVTTDILNGFSQKNLTIACFFDVEKAYDTLNRDLILQELNLMGITGNMYNFIKEFLKGRSFQVKIGNTLSDHRFPQKGIPQGSVISTTLFNIGINRILENLDPEMKGSLYADDLMIYY